MSRINIRVRVSADASQIDALLAKLRPIAADPSVLAALLRQAVAETFLVAFRERFVANLPAAVNTLLVADENKTQGAIPLGLSRELATTLANLTSAQLGGRRAEAKEMQDRLGVLSERLADAVKPKGTSSGLSTGRFRELALDIMAMLTQANHLGVSVGANGVQVGIGELTELESVATPSFKATASNRQMLFRQLEFGTGVFASDPGLRDAGSSSSLPDGTWWYGKPHRHRIHLRGAPGVHALFDPQTQVMYSEDGLRFETVFAGLLHQALAP